MKYSQRELERLQAALYETLAEVDRICRKHGIRYFNVYGPNDETIEFCQIV